MDGLDLDAAIISDPKNVYYLSGFWGPTVNVIPTYLVLNRDRADSLVTGETAAKTAQTSFRGEVVTFENYGLKSRMLARPDVASTLVGRSIHIQRRGFTTVGIESWHTPKVILDSIEKDAGHGAKFLDLSRQLEHMRTIKDPDEVDAIRSSCRLLDHAFAVARSVSLPGDSEVDVYAAVHGELARKVGGFQFFSGDFKTGARSEDNDSRGEPTRTELKKGDTLILDLWATTKGYWADTCRTFAIGGTPTKDQAHVHKVIKTALKAGAESLKPGARAREVYAAIQGVIREAGYAENFPHHAGHCVGLDAWEPPFIIPGSDEVLKPGMVCALEPGIYVKGRAGVSLEDDYLIKDDGAVSLMKYPLSL